MSTAAERIANGGRPDPPAVVGLFVDRCLKTPDSLLEKLLTPEERGDLKKDLSAYLTEEKELRPAGRLAKVLAEIEAGGEMRFFRVARDQEEPSADGALYNIVLDPIHDGPDGKATIAVLAPRVELAANWSTVYIELAKAHQATMDLRTKLLAALPVLTGTGVGLILANSSGLGTQNAGGFSPWALVALGIFGFVVSFGLFMYELRNIRECVAFLHRGEALEALVGAPAGQFLRRPDFQRMRDALSEPDRATKRGKRGWISIHRASHVVYISILVAWLGLTVFGFIAAA